VCVDAGTRSITFRSITFIDDALRDAEDRTQLGRVGAVEHRTHSEPLRLQQRIAVCVELPVEHVTRDGALGLHRD
jgi:hypothetical protein